ncbi:MAG TPA: hypothetical protein VHI52_21920, partial [Verrucomicrobiae bacterium]|nr:hypothetical protein [Verrucomicrobiae bacterium]
MGGVAEGAGGGALGEGLADEAGFFGAFHELVGGVGAFEDAALFAGVVRGAEGFVPGEAELAAVAADGFDAEVAVMAAVVEEDAVEEAEVALAVDADEDFEVIAGAEVGIEEAGFVLSGAAGEDCARGIDAFDEHVSEGDGLGDVEWTDAAIDEAEAFAAEGGEGAGVEGVAGGIDHVSEAVDGGGVWVVEEDLSHEGECFGVVEVVAVHEGDEGGLGVGEGVAVVAGACDAGVGFGDGTDAGVALGDLLGD